MNKNISIESNKDANADGNYMCEPINLSYFAGNVKNQNKWQFKMQP